MTDKSGLRRALRGLRAAAGARTIAAPSQWLERLRTGLLVATYIPIGGEADPVALVDAALAAGCTIALPHVVDRATPLRFLAHDAALTLTQGPFGLRQPDPEAREVAPDIVLTPLVGFDRRGNRIGQGAGHYDRAFAAHPGAWRVGVALSVQEVAAISSDPWDVPLHAIVTEQEWITP